MKVKLHVYNDDEYACMIYFMYKQTFTMKVQFPVYNDEYACMVYVQTNIYHESETLYA